MVTCQLELSHTDRENVPDPPHKTTRDRSHRYPNPSSLIVLKFHQVSQFVGAPAPRIVSEAPTPFALMRNGTVRIVNRTLSLTQAFTCSVPHLQRRGPSSTPASTLQGPAVLGAPQCDGSRGECPECPAEHAAQSVELADGAFQF